MTDPRALYRRARSAWCAYWFEPAPLVDLGIARVVLCFVALTQFQFQRYPLLALIPETLWKPVPVLAAFDVGLPTFQQIRALAIGAQVCLWLGLLGVFARPALLIAAVLLFSLEGIQNSFGKVGHGSIPFLWAVLFFGLSPCDRAFSLRRLWERARSGPKPHRETSRFARWPLDLTFLELGTFYLAAGLSKLRLGGIAWADGETMQALLRRDGGLVAAWVAESQWLCAALSIAALAFELGAIAGVHRGIRPWVLAGGVAFHVSTGLLMGIWFLPFLRLYLIFVPWRRWLGGAWDRARRRLR